MSEPDNSSPLPGSPTAGTAPRPGTETPRGLYLVEPVTPIVQVCASIVPSAHPEEVFASLAEVCVPIFSDTCSVLFTEGERPTYAKQNPPGCDRSSVSSASVAVMIDAVTQTSRYRGSVVFGWQDHRPTAAEFAVGELLVMHCSSLITQQGLAEGVINLERALQSNRRIGAALGILMSVLKVTEQQAFAALRTQSQNQHRKLRDVAEDVLESGWLEGDGRSSLAEDDTGNDQC